MVADMIKPAKPSMTISFTNERVGFNRSLTETCNIASFPNKNLRTRIAAMSCDITDASAAPFTPILSTKIKTGSNIIFIMAPVIM